MNMTNLTNVQLNRVQENMISRIYDAEHNSPLRARINARYSAIVQLLLSRLGPDYACHEIDPELNQTFSDCFKDENGCRPGIWNYEMTKSYMDRVYAEYKASCP